MTEPELVVEAAGEAATRSWGRRLGELARPGDFFALVGNLGAGKTVLAHAILEALGVEDAQGSPTFTLVHEYRGRLAGGAAVDVYHVDLYRLGPEAAREDLGYDAYFYGDGVAVVEWADLARRLWPAEHLAVALDRPRGGDPRRRRLAFAGAGRRGHELVDALASRGAEPSC